jgi:hypothetical protein
MNLQRVPALSPDEYHHRPGFQRVAPLIGQHRFPARRVDVVRAGLCRVDG